MQLRPRLVTESRHRKSSDGDGGLVPPCRASAAHMPKDDEEEEDAFASLPCGRPQPRCKRNPVKKQKMAGRNISAASPALHRPWVGEGDGDQHRLCPRELTVFFFKEKGAKCFECHMRPCVLGARRIIGSHLRWGGSTYG